MPDLCLIWPHQAVVNDYFQRAPMLAIEVASRGNTPDELQQKVNDYLETGAAEVIVIFPKSRTPVIYRPGETLRVAAGEDYRCDLIGVVFTPEYRMEIE